MLQDVTILYQGGSGGFLLFYYLLLSGQYQTGLEFDTVEQLILQQFPTSLARQPAGWKQKEFWPDNELCKITKDSPRLYLICNPLWPDMEQNNQLVSAQTQKYLLYTDIHTQLRMCYEKQAYWFTDLSKKHFMAPANEKSYIKQILKSADGNLDPMVAKVVKTFNPAYQIKLQDFVKHKILPGQESPNQAQIEFVNYWSSIQPLKVRHLLNA